MGRTRSVHLQAEPVVRRTVTVIRMESRVKCVGGSMKDVVLVDVCVTRELMLSPTLADVLSVSFNIEHSIRKLQCESKKSP